MWHNKRESPTAPEEYTLYHLPMDKTKTILATLALNGAPIEMEVDTGAAASIMSYATYTKLWPAEEVPPLVP